MTIILPDDLRFHVRMLVDFTFEHDSDDLPSDVYEARNLVEAWLNTIGRDLSDEEQDARDDVQPSLPIPMAWEDVLIWENVDPDVIELDDTDPYQMIPPGRYAGDIEQPYGFDASAGDGD